MIYIEIDKREYFKHMSLADYPFVHEKLTGKNQFLVLFYNGKFLVFFSIRKSIEMSDTIFRCFCG